MKIDLGLPPAPLKDSVLYRERKYVRAMEAKLELTWFLDNKDLFCNLTVESSQSLRAKIEHISRRSADILQ